MDMSNNFSDQYQSGWSDVTGTSKLFVSQPCQTSTSEEDIILASNTPKKRAGRTKFKETRHPVYRGIRIRNNDRWVCEVREPNKQTRIWLGTHPTAEMAARAHDVAALALRGQSACLNFADSVWRLPVPASNEVKDIQKAAMEAAEMFRPGKEKNREEVKDYDRDSSSDEGIMGMWNMTSEDTGGSSYNDEEAMLDMPQLMRDMAEAMMLSPPRCFDGNMSWHYEENTDTELPLWSYLS